MSEKNTESAKLHNSSNAAGGRKGPPKGKPSRRPQVPVREIKRSPVDYLSNSGRHKVFSLYPHVKIEKVVTTAYPNGAVDHQIYVDGAVMTTEVLIRLESEALARIRAQREESKSSEESAKTD